MTSHNYSWLVNDHSYHWGHRCGHCPDVTLAQVLRKQYVPLIQSWCNNDYHGVPLCVLEISSVSKVFKADGHIVYNLYRTDGNAWREDKGCASFLACVGTPQCRLVHEENSCNCQTGLRLMHVN